MIDREKDNVVFLNVETTLDITPDRALEQAKGKLDFVVVLGYEKNGSKYIASSSGDCGRVILLLERCKHELITITEERMDT